MRHSQAVVHVACGTASVSAVSPTRTVDVDGLAAALWVVVAMTAWATNPSSVSRTSFVMGSPLAQDACKHATSVGPCYVAATHGRGGIVATTVDPTVQRGGRGRIDGAGSGSSSTASSPRPRRLGSAPDREAVAALGPVPAPLGSGEQD